MNPLALFRTLARVLFAPVRALRHLLSRVYRKSVVVNASEAGGVIGQATSEAVGQGLGLDLKEAGQGLEGEPAGVAAQDAAPGGVLFRMMPPLYLSEQTASELSLSTAKTYQKRAELFYQDAVHIMPPGGLFYEEVERDHVERALSVDQPIASHTVTLTSPSDGEDAEPEVRTVPGELFSVDKRFSQTTKAFRETFNANSRRIMLYYVPALFSVVLAYLYFFPMALFTYGHNMINGMADVGAGTGALDSLMDVGPLSVTLVTIALVYVLYQWPYRVSQQIISLNINNYISQKFGRMSQHFQVAKRQALNVERNARMRDAAQLKEDAGTWAIAYNWIAMRLLFCEVLIRNTLFQVRRNTTLYKLAGVTLCLLFVGAVIVWQWIWPSRMFSDQNVAFNLWLIEVGAVSVFFVAVVYGLVIRNPFRIVRESFNEKNWHRFHSVRLDTTVADHVGEDKLQIITFRDRNRME